MDCAALIADGNLDVGARADHGERLRPGLHAASANAFEPWSDVVGGDEIDNAGGVDEATQPAVPHASPGKNDGQDQHGEAHPHRRYDRAFHLKLL